MSLESRKAHILSLGLDPNKFSLLQEYIDLLWKSNEELNLISRKMTLDDLIENHIIDCLLPLKYFPNSVKRVADFGSGGGLPAVIYALQFPEVQFELYEKSPKKQEFLKKCAVQLAPNICVQGEIRPDLKVDLVMARGFKPVDVILEMSRVFYRGGGKYFLLKGRLEKIQEELALAKKKEKSLEYQVVKLTSPVLEVERNLVLI